jgi:excinuclease ABC subunit A
MFEPPSEPLFNYNNPLGACQSCSGYGKIVGIDESLVIPDPSLSIYKEAIACWRGEVMKSFYLDLIENSENFDFPIHKPYKDLSQEHKELLWKGNSFFTGIDDFFKMVEANRYKIQYRYMLSRYSGKTICPDCKGKRLKPEALYIKVGGKSIVDLLDMSIEDLTYFIDNLLLDNYSLMVAERIIVEIKNRLKGLMDVGLPYLTLNRLSNTLSGGESQRINLVSSLSGGLVGTLYILDEPSIGLHSRDTQRLIAILKKLRDSENTVLIVEHDQEIMRASDYLIDIGPLAGSFGGEVIFSGDINSEFYTNKEYARNGVKSLTLEFLEGRERIEVPRLRRSWNNSITISGVSENNLKNVSVKFPLNILTVVTGVSGSGKSTLVKSVLYNILNRNINQKGDKPGSYDNIIGDLSKISAVEYIDQNPIGRSSRSNAVTYLKIYDEIRKLFSEQPYAKMNGYGHSHFSFNIDGGRCPECMGEGVITIEMQFMADVKMVCESCEGKRFKSDILEVKYKGLNINDILNLSVEEAIEFFGSQSESSAKRIAEKLEPLRVVGLSYIKLGQSSSTLSGGESQRVKLASFLSKDGSSESILFIFDEPTTGLHFYDIKKLLFAFNALIDKGHSIILIEHNLDVVKSADWVIDLGPEGGDRGGSIVFEGIPEDLLKCDKSYTGDALKSIM